MQRSFVRLFLLSVGRSVIRWLVRSIGRAVSRVFVLSVGPSLIRSSVRSRIRSFTNQVKPIGAKDRNGSQQTTFHFFCARISRDL